MNPMFSQVSNQRHFPDTIPEMNISLNSGGRDQIFGILRQVEFEGQSNRTERFKQIKIPDPVEYLAKY